MDEIKQFRVVTEGIKKSIKNAFLIKINIAFNYLNVYNLKMNVN